MVRGSAGRIGGGRGSLSRCRVQGREETGAAVRAKTNLKKQQEQPEQDKLNENSGQKE
jgi:hypothetical protein